MTGLIQQRNRIRALIAQLERGSLATTESEILAAIAELAQSAQDRGVNIPGTIRHLRGRTARASIVAFGRPKVG